MLLLFYRSPSCHPASGNGARKQIFRIFPSTSLGIKDFSLFAIHKNTSLSLDRREFFLSRIEESTKRIFFYNGISFSKIKQTAKREEKKKKYTALQDSKLSRKIANHLKEIFRLPSLDLVAARKERGTNGANFHYFFAKLVG